MPHPRYLHRAINHPLPDAYRAALAPHATTAPRTRPPGHVAIPAVDRQASPAGEGPPAHGPRASHARWVLPVAACGGTAGVLVWALGPPALRSPALLALALAAAATLVWTRLRRGRRAADPPAPRARRATRPGLGERGAAVADRVLAAVVLALLLPAVVLVGVVVKGTIGGPVLVRRERLGPDGRISRVLAFRTTGAGTDGGSGTRAGAPAPRTGQLLQRLSVDRLPRLVDVVRGDLPFAASGRH